jgi:hypothetical protein
MHAHKLYVCYLLNEINIVQCTMFKLCPTSWEGEVLPRDLNPVLTALVLYQFSVRNIVVPYLEKEKKRRPRISGMNIVLDTTIKAHESAAAQT